MKKIVLVIMLIFISACGNQPTTIQNKPSATLTYFKDEKTNLCFAQLGSTTKDLYVVTSIAQVPCEKVEQFLLK